MSTAAPALATTSATAVQAVLGIYGRATKPLKALSPDNQRIDLRVWSAKAQGWEPLSEGLHGHWVQAYYVHLFLADAGGRVFADVTEEKVVFAATIPE